MKKAFTLAETMIVLVVIGVLSAILLPVAQNMKLNKDLMKFKNTYNALVGAIAELAASDKYYLDGDLGSKPNGMLLDGTHEGDELYLCQTLSQVLKTKKVNCQKFGTTTAHMAWSVSENTSAPKSDHSFCESVQWNVGEERGATIITQDGAIIYEGNSSAPFGFRVEDGSRLFAPDKNLLNHWGYNYKYLCFDIDGWNSGHKPFLILVRVDGKVEPAALAAQWLEKTMNDE